MNKDNKVGTFSGIIIYHYDFVNKKGQKIQCTKYLFNVYGFPIFVTSKTDKDKPVGLEVTYDLGYDGSKWVVL